MRAVFCCVLVVTGLLAGCTKKAEGSKTSPSPQAITAGGVLEGKVAETLEATGYTYLRLNTSSGETWAAVPQTKIAIGSDVAIKNPARMDGFESKTLNRKFEKIVFGTLAGADTAEPMPTAVPGNVPQGMAGKHPPVTPAITDFGEIKVAKAAGPDGRTVAELYAQKAKLKDAKVAIKGKVVKFSAGIMGRNWVHLRDGSGTPDAQNNDITVTTQDTVAVGDEVLAKGTVHIDKDFGAGYMYPVIVEEASISK